MCPWEIVRRYFNYLLIHLYFLCQCRKDEDDDPDSPSIERSASRIMIIMKTFLFSILFISLSCHLKLSIDIFIMSVIKPSSRIN